MNRVETLRMRVLGLGEIVSKVHGILSIVVIATASGCAPSSSFEVMDSSAFAQPSASPTRMEIPRPSRNKPTTSPGTNRPTIPPYSEVPPASVRDDEDDREEATGDADENGIRIPDGPDVDNEPIVDPNEPVVEEDIDKVDDKKIDPLKYKADWDGEHPDAAKWTRAVVRAIESHGKALKHGPLAAYSFCPNYKELSEDQRIGLFVKLISAMAKKESNFRPVLEFKESFKVGGNDPERKDLNVVSVGLLQISIDSAKSYRCPVRTSADLKVPEKNLVCGVRILNHWVERHGVIADSVNKAWKGGARYWSVLRKLSSRKIIQTSTKELAFCKQD